MKIVLAGGSGHLGQLLSQAFSAEGHEIVVLTRGESTSGPIRNVHWDAKKPGDWERELDGSDLLINLVGRSVNCRYTAENRRAILDSRVNATHALGAALTRCAKPPRLWLQSSTATLYSHRYDAPNDEATGLIGGEEPSAPDSWHFSIRVAREWEAAAAHYLPLPATRCVFLRTSIAMHSLPGGPLTILSRLARLGLGGYQGDGRQYVSWIHEEDFIRALRWIIDHEELTGPINLAAPHPLPNRDFMRAIRQAWHCPIGLPAAAWMLEIGAFFLRTDTELILKSRRVVPGRLLDSGFTFHYPEWPEAVRDLAQRMS